MSKIPHYIESGVQPTWGLTGYGRSVASSFFITSHYPVIFKKKLWPDLENYRIPFLVISGLDIPF